MQFPDFTPFFFEPISFSLFYEKLNPEYHFVSEAIVQETYDAWLDEFLRRSKKFYHAQYVRHENFVLRDFWREYKIPEYSTPSEYDLDREWNGKYRDSGLYEHQNKYILISQQIIEARNDLNLQSGDGNLLRVAEKFNASIRRPLPAKAINELWFNTTINNPTELESDLRCLDYPVYLKSSHWARLKSAMLLIHDAVCQADFCFQEGESWYFGDWESDIHVHHLNYGNLGNERYNDLVLLCSRHHALWHENIQKIGTPGIEVFDEWIF